MYWQNIIRRGLKRLRSGVPTTDITQPFDRVQATHTLNAVLDRGTFEEINAVFLALVELGYTAYPSSGNPSSWQIVPIELLRSDPGRASIEQAHSPRENPTLGDIQRLAAELEFDFRGGEHDGTFDLAKRSDQSIGGTWSNTQPGIEDGYGYLERYRLTLEKSDQSRGRL